MHTLLAPGWQAYSAVRGALRASFHQRPAPRLPRHPPEMDRRLQEEIDFELTVIEERISAKLRDLDSLLNTAIPDPYKRLAAFEMTEEIVELNRDSKRARRVPCHQCGLDLIGCRCHLEIRRAGAEEPPMPQAVIVIPDEDESSSDLLMPPDSDDNSHGVLQCGRCTARSGESVFYDFCDWCGERYCAGHMQHACVIE